MFSNSFEYATRHGIALFPIAAGTKIPLPGFRWTVDASHEATAWHAWFAAHRCNFGIAAEQSELIVLDVDASRVGRAAAWTAWCNLCSEWGLAGPLAPMTQSARMGWHIAIARPPGLDAAALRGTAVLVRDPAGSELIGAKVRGYTVAAGSYYDGTARGEQSGPYVLLPDAPPPHPCPGGLLEALARPVVMATPAAAGQSDPVDLAALVDFLAGQGEFADYSDWIACGMACKLAAGDAGLAAWALAHDGTVTPEVESAKWQSFATEPKPGAVTIGSLIRRARELGWRGSVRRSTEAMFGDVAAPPTALAGATSMIGGPRPVPRPPEYGETEIAERFAAKHANELRYVKTWGTWLHWTGKRWQRDSSDFVVDLARTHCREESALAASTPGTNNPRTLCSERTVNAVTRLARVDRRIAATPETWDQDPWLLGTPEGIIDLQTGGLRPAQPEDHVTKSAAVTPGGSCPQWLRFLQRATSGDTDLEQYLQRLCGYALTGSTREHSLHFIFGPGGAGKGTFAHVLESVLAEYHVTTAIQTFTESKYDRHPAEIAALHGARLVTCSETERGRHWAESRVKELTGGDTISARYMNQNFFNFVPTFKILISGNYKPHMRPDAAMRRRFQLIPFTASIPESEKDVALGEKLQGELPGILAWMVAGCIAWQRDGLRPPAVVLDATDEYFEEEAEDILNMWIRECCEVDPQADAPHGVLYASFKNYADRSGERPISSKQFAKDLRSLKFETDRTSRARLVVGLKLRDAPPPPGPHWPTFNQERMS